jgi:hypothetical protein
VKFMRSFRGLVLPIGRMTSDPSSDDEELLLDLLSELIRNT